MSTPIISVENLGKRYTIRHEAGRTGGYRRLSEELMTAAKTPFRALAARFGTGGRAPSESTSIEDFWALRNVSFDVRHGEVLGIIGRNGAGKSTLLKVLSRITEPSEGRVTMRGRVASLLEVGTGFHPELTGRENIFLNGTILGMSRDEIKRRFDEIVAFAEVERFLDTPVKRYSSGMYVRLAFAVAAHLEPEMLIIDEVLAVGDTEFQKKCLGKMGEVAKRGRTVIFVSHNLASVSSLCRRALLLSQGRLTMDGSSEAVIDSYLSEIKTAANGGDGFFRIEQEVGTASRSARIVQSVEICDETMQRRLSFRMGDGVCIVLRISGLSAYPRGALGVTIKSRTGQWLASFNSNMLSVCEDNERASDEYAVLEIDRLPYTPGRYTIDIQVANRNADYLQMIENAAYFDIVPTDVYGTGYAVSDFYGITYLEGLWRFRNADDSA